ncbi:unnamed protein product [Mucor circinelloides]|uniref:Uncharacterized protein n=1 Tax=Mucor circinelloides f. circinelloides (strain 1006PhL) TaxID=1220926 RepID=S2K389_MUCC1|nr:hypothetical protein HMPREF1544_06560 [Mucor circinelloides 1006PhL]KAG1092193.1 hypothetical protein G6F42_019262 [Rhizopus arrhizus]
MMHSSSTSSLHYFDSIKWKKRLHKISDKLHRSHNNYHWNVKSASKSATALAAATEKFIRTESTDIAIRSEDLTASQFANLTGIKTKRNSTTHSIYSSDYIYSDSDEDDSEDDDYSTMATSTNGTASTTMKIWDSHFWQDGRKSLPTIHTAPLVKSTSLNQVATSSVAVATATATTTTTAHLTSQPLVRNKSEPGKSSCVQKGRFKIVWGQEDTIEIKPQVQCVEWKRKRASSNPIQQ